jgi:hypothetical protein
MTMSPTAQLTDAEHEMLDGALDVATQLAMSEHEQHKGLGQIIAGLCAIIIKYTDADAEIAGEK